MYKSANYLLENYQAQPIEYYVYKGPNPSLPYEKSIEYGTSPSPSPSPSPLPGVEMKFENLKDTSTSNPNIWGPPLWFTLHNTAIKFPVNASPLYISKMKDFIISIPYILPCEQCKVHASNYIEENKQDLDNICSGREKLFKFFVDFHNKVNKRQNKTEISYEDAYKIYTGQAFVTKISYTGLSDRGF